MLRNASQDASNKCPSVWQLFSWATTCCFPGFALAWCGGIKGAAPQQAWREKVALCWIIAFISCLVLYFVVFFNVQLCPPDMKQYIGANTDGGVIIRGLMYNAYGVRTRERSDAYF